MNPTLSIKKAVAAFLYYSGCIHFLENVKDKPGIILAYHRILPKESVEITYTQPGMYVTTESFEKHMAFISKNFSIMRLEDLANGTSHQNSCIVTFDDGWADNYTNALPILKRYGIPATIFLSTNVVGKREWPWTDRVCFYIHSASLEEFIGTWEEVLQKSGLEHFKPAFTSQDKGVVREQVISHMKAMDNQEVLSIIDELDKVMANQNQQLMKTRPWLTWDEVMEMREEGISFGSHTHNHLILNSVPLLQARDEILTSQKMLSKKTGSTATMFCYPNGDFNHEIMRIVADAGYKIAVTTRRGFINESSSLLALNRIMMHDDMTSSIPMLACVLTNRIPFF
ncbi:MAG: polysaccharide deacetylase family protein [Syntrophorhabdus sp.]